MAVNFPTTLPNPVTDGYTEEPETQIMRTEMERGAIRTRRISRSIVDMKTVSWKFTDAQYTAFRTWFFDTAKGGVEWINLRLNSDSLVTARFASNWKASILPGRNWIVSATLEVDTSGTYSQ